MRSEHSSRNPLGRPAADRASRVAIIVQDVMRRSDTGASVDLDELCRVHGDLMPELGNRLRTLRRLLSAEHRALARSSDAHSPDQGEITPAERSWLETGIPGYEICRRLGRGGQGSVYLAMQKSTGRNVAIKVLTAGPVADEHALRRFDREVNLLLHLNHPNIVTVHDKGVVNGHPYFVMEYVDGMVITDYAFLHNLSAKDRLRLFVQVAKVVRDAHQRGVIHRDLKPSNILVDDKGTPRVLDFGLGKALDEMSASDQVTSLSAAGQVMGTLPYLSPEQADGAADIDTRADVYSLGVALFELLTGQLPIETSGTRLAAYNRIMLERPRRVRECLHEGAWDGFCKPSDIGDDLEAIVAMALAKERAERYQSADALVQDLERYLAGEAIQARFSQGYYQLRMALRRHRKAVAVATAFAILVTASLVTVALFWVEARTARNNALTASNVAQETLYKVVSEVDEIIAPVAGGVEARNRVLSELAPNLDQLSNLAGPDSMTDELFALTHEKRGEIALAEGRRDDARAHFEWVRANATRALSAGAVSEDRLAGLVRAHSRLAQVTDEPDQHHQEAVRLARELFSRDSTNSAYLQTLNQALLSWGQYQYSEGRYQEAIKPFEEILNGLELTRVGRPADTSETLMAALALMWCGNTRYFLGDGQRSLEYLNESVRLLQQLVASRPFDVRIRSELVFAYEYLSDYLMGDGRYDDAVEVGQKAEAECVTLATMEPTVAKWRLHLVTSRYRLGQTCLRLEEFDRAAYWADRAFEALLSKDGSATDAHDIRNEAAFCHLLRGRVQLGFQQYEKAEQDFQVSLRMRQELAAADPTNDRQQEDLAMTYNYIAQCVRQQDRHDEAYKAYKSALEIRLELLNRGKDVTTRTLAVASSYMKLAVWHLDQRTLEHDLAAIPDLDRAEAMLIELRDSGRMIGRAGELKLWLDSIDDNRRLIERRAVKRQNANSLADSSSNSAPPKCIAAAE